MIKKIIGISSILVMLTLSILNAYNNYGLLNNDLSYEILAQTNSSGSGGDSSGAGIATEEECRNKNGYWNMALVLQSSGVTPISCDIDGKLVIMGLTIFNASYKQGNTYYIAWESFTCTNSTGNCCIASQQGLKIIEGGSSS